MVEILQHTPKEKKPTEPKLGQRIPSPPKSRKIRKGDPNYNVLMTKARNAIDSGLQQLKVRDKEQVKKLVEEALNCINELEP